MAGQLAFIQVLLFFFFFNVQKNVSFSPLLIDVESTNSRMTLGGQRLRVYFKEREWAWP